MTIVEHLQHSFRGLFLKGETTKGETETDCRLKGKSDETESENVSQRFGTPQAGNFGRLLLSIAYFFSISGI